MKTSSLTFLVLVAALGLALFGCDESDDSNPIETQNQTPLPPSDPDPENNETDILQSAVLTWTCSDPDEDPLTYDVYLGSNPTPQLEDEGVTVASFDPDTLYADATYYWRIVAKDDHGHSTTGDIWTFETGPAPILPADVPSSPNPADEATDVSLQTTLTWVCSGSLGNVLLYDVYFGTDETPSLVSENQTDASFSPDLDYGTAYYWKIDAKNSIGDVTNGLIWSFTTVTNQPPATPTPLLADGSEDVDIATALTWSCNDPEGEIVTYDIYFGESPEPERVATGQTETTYQPDQTLKGGTTYYWQVSAHDEYGNTTSSEIWSFTTEREHDFPLGETGLTVSMIWIDQGSFTMGAHPFDVDAMGDENPSHNVTISYGFWMGKYEVTQEQWESVMGSWSFRFDDHPNRPAERVSWYSVREFTSTLNEVESGDPWRLPTEAEWEYACRAGEGTSRFWWGNDGSYTMIDDYAWHWDNNDTGNGHETHDVGLKLPNPWGLHDMNGNVWEWCEDSYHNSYVGVPTDGSAWESGDANGRIARGGGWGSYGAPFCRSSARGRDNPNDGYDIFGFRLARTAE